MLRAARDVIVAGLVAQLALGVAAIYVAVPRAAALVALIVPLAAELAGLVVYLARRPPRAGWCGRHPPGVDRRVI